MGCTCSITAPSIPRPRSIRSSPRSPAVESTPAMWFGEAGRRLQIWWRRRLLDPYAESWTGGDDALPDARGEAVEYPWRHRWAHLPKRSAGFGFSLRDYAAARKRAEEVARLTVGDEVWARVRRDGHV